MFWWLKCSELAIKVETSYFVKVRMLTLRMSFSVRIYWTLLDIAIISNLSFKQINYWIQDMNRTVSLLVVGNKSRSTDVSTSGQVTLNGFLMAIINKLNRFLLHDLLERSSGTNGTELLWVFLKKIEKRVNLNHYNQISSLPFQGLDCHKDKHLEWYCSIEFQLLDSLH